MVFSSWSGGVTFLLTKMIRGSLSLIYHVQNTWLLNSKSIDKKSTKLKRQSNFNQWLTRETLVMRRMPRLNETGTRLPTWTRPGQMATTTIRRVILRMTTWRMRMGQSHTPNGDRLTVLTWQQEQWRGWSTEGVAQHFLKYHTDLNVRIRALKVLPGAAKNPPDFMKESNWNDTHTHTVIHTLSIVGIYTYIH